jgi:hypothetical protein
LDPVDINAGRFQPGFAFVPATGRERVTLEEAVFQALGAASMCWSETPKGTFDSTRAKEIGDALLEVIARHDGGTA